MWKLIQKLPDAYSGKRIDLQRHQISNGEIETTWDIAHVASAVAVLPIIDDCYIFVKQHRYPIDQNGILGPIIECCAGKLEEGQTPQEAAIAELKQETGYIAKKWTCIGEFYSSPGITDEKIHAFIAEELISGKQELEVSEKGLEVVRIPIIKTINLIRRGKIKDQKTTNLVLLHYLEYISNKL